MNPEQQEKNALDSQSDIRQIKEEMADLKSQVGEIYYALVGNKLNKDGGLIQRLKDMEMELHHLNERMDKAEKVAIRSNTYLYIVWTLVGFAAATVFTIILEHAFKK